MGRNSFDIDDRILLIRVVCQEDRKALATLYLKYAPQVRSYIFSCVSSITDTEDLVQEVFLQIWQGKGHYDSSKGVESYILGIARNMIRRYHRRKRKIRSSETVFIRSISTIDASYDIHRCQDSQGQILAQQFKRITEFAITRLQPTEREAIRLRFMDGLGPKEAAKKAGCSIGAFYKRLERAKRALRETVKKD